MNQNEKELNVQVKQELGTIHFNYEEIKANLSAKMELYKDATFTEDSKQMAKKEVATLRKIKAAIDTKRKEVKAKCLKPYEDFEIKANELMSLVDEPIQLIDKQVKAFEEKTRQEKVEKIHSIYAECIEDMGDYLPLQKIYNKKWENKATALKSIKEDLTAVVSSTKLAVQTIRSMQSDAVPKALEKYKQTLDMAGAITYINQYEQQKLEIEKRAQEQQRMEAERQAREQEQRIREEERRRIQDEERIREEERKKMEQEQLEKKQEELPTFADIATVAESEPFQTLYDSEELYDPEEVGFALEKPSTVQAIYEVVATAEELEEMEIMLNSMGISFERKGE